MIEIKDKGTIDSKRVLNIAKVLLNNKAFDVVIYDTRKKTPLFNYVIICSATNIRQLNGISTAAQNALFSFYKDVKNIEGRNESKWIVVDAYDTVIHIIEQEERDRLDIDSLYIKYPHKLITDNTDIPETRERKNKHAQF